MAPEYREAQIIYLIGAIYAGDRKTEAELIKILPEGVLIEDRVVGAYLARERFEELINLLSVKMNKNPNDPSGYTTLAAVYIKAKKYDQAIAVLIKLGENIPAYKSVAESYIEQIKNGSLR